MSFEDKVWLAFAVALLIVVALGVLVVDGPRLLDMWRVRQRRNARGGWIT